MTAMGSPVPIFPPPLMVSALAPARILFVVLWLLLATYLLTLLWSKLIVGRVLIDRRFVDRACAGDEVAVDLVIRNAGWLPIPFLQAGETVPVELSSHVLPRRVLSLGPHAEAHISYTLMCRRRGCYAIGPVEGWIGSALGIGRRNTVWGEPQQLVVYPRIVPLERLDLLTFSPHVALPAAARLVSDPSRIMGVRDYRPGDALRHIHWSSTARLGRPVVKQYQPAMARDTLICLDLDPNAYTIAWRDSIEWAVVVAASLASHMIARERLPAGLAAEVRDPDSGAGSQVTLLPRADRKHLIDILEVLARAQPPERGRTLVNLLQESSVRLPWGASIVAITGALDRQLAETLLLLKRRGHAVAVILAQPIHVVQHENPPGVAVFQVWEDIPPAALA